MRLWALALVALLAAGCIKANDTTLFKAHGASPIAFVGYDYDGLTAASGTGEADITVDAAKDTGTAHFTFSFANHTWAVAFDKFAETKPFQEGGVRDDFPEHGDSGNGDAMLPRIHALSAGWGTGSVTVDGALFTDPASASQAFNLHYMVTDTPIRDASTHKVTNAAGSAPYDPAKPTDARVLQGQQVYLNVQSSGQAQPVTTPFSVQSTLPTPGTDETKAVAQVNGSAPARVNITYALQSSGGGVLPIPAFGQVAFILLADGNKVDECDVAFPPADPTNTTSGCTHDIPSAPPGTYTVHVTAQVAAGNAYTVTGTFTQASAATFVHVVYTDVTVG